jgi:hypothetical protein
VRWIRATLLAKVSAPEAPTKPAAQDKSALDDTGMVTLAAAFKLDRSGHLFFLGSKFVLSIEELPISGGYLVGLKGLAEKEQIGGSATLFYKRKEAEPTQAVESAATTPAGDVQVVTVAAAHKLWLEDKVKFHQRGFYVAAGMVTRIERLVGPDAEYLLHIDGDAERMLAKGEESLMQKVTETGQAAPTTPEAAEVAAPSAGEVPSAGTPSPVAPVNVRLRDIQFEKDIQSRDGMNSGIVADYAAYFQERGYGSFPPVDLFDDGEKKWIGDGNHRIAGAQLAGLEQIPAIVRKGSRRDAILHAVGANHNHGLRRTNADKRRSVRMLLLDEEWRAWSDHKIADHVKVDHKTVGNIRREMEVSGEIPQTESRKAERAGATYEVETAGINAGRKAAEDGVYEALPEAAPLQQLAPERRAEGWRKANERAAGAPVTVEMVQAAVDEMLGKAGRFDNERLYPVDHDNRRVFIVPDAENEKYDMYSDPRFEGCEKMEGQELNDGRKFDGYSLVEVPEIHPQDLTTVLPSLTKDNEYRVAYPVDHSGRVIYNAPNSGQTFRPEATYKECTWISGSTLRREWFSVQRCLGEYQVSPAREVPTDWVKTSAFQPGMAATCPECAKASWRSGASIYAYEKWQPIEEAFFGCPVRHRVQVDDLAFGTLPAPEQAPAQSSPGNGSYSQPARGLTEEEKAKRAAEQRRYELHSALTEISYLDDLLTLLRNTPDLVRQALNDQALLLEHREDSYPEGQPTEEAVGIVRNWLDNLAALPDLAKPVAQDTEDDDIDEDLDEDETDIDEDDDTEDEDGEDLGD